MIRSIRHRGLKRFYENGDPRGLFAEHVQKLRDILARLDAADTLADIAHIPGFKMHPLKGDLKGYFAVTVRASWRLIFRFTEGEVADIDYIDYH